MQRSVYLRAKLTSPTQRAKKVASVWHLKRRDGNFSIGLVDLRSFRHHRDSPPANSRPQFYQTSSTFTVRERKTFSGELTGGEVNQICAISNSRTTLRTTWKFAVFPAPRKWKAVKTFNKNLFFNSALLALTQSMNASCSTNLFTCSNHHFSNNN